MKKPSDKNPPDSRRKGSRYSDEDKARISAAVLARMEGGQTAFKACEAEGVPYVTFNWWCGEQPALAEAYARAREGLIARMAQELADIADEPVILTPDGKLDSAAVQKQRLQIDTRKWLLSKLAPKKYGERLELAGDADSPIKAAVTVEFVKAK
jgi:hypothetical protein